jgi:hypothetical protein
MARSMRIMYSKEIKEMLFRSSIVCFVSLFTNVCVFFYESLSYCAVWFAFNEFDFFSRLESLSQFRLFP